MVRVAFTIYIYILRRYLIIPVPCFVSLDGVLLSVNWSVLLMSEERGRENAARDLLNKEKTQQFCMQKEYYISSVWSQRNCCYLRRTKVGLCCGVSGQTRQ